MQLAAARDQELIRDIRLFDTQRDVRLELAVEAGSNLTGGHERAFAPSERRGVDADGHAYCRWLEIEPRKRIGRVNRCNRVPDVDRVESRQQDNVAGASLG